MYDVQTTVSTGHDHNSGSNPVSFTVTVPTGRVPVGGGFFRSAGGANTSVPWGSYKSAADTWTFTFGGNNSGVTVTYTLHVYHVPESEVVQVLRVKP